MTLKFRLKLVLHEMYTSHVMSCISYQYVIFKNKTELINYFGEEIKIQLATVVIKHDIIYIQNVNCTQLLKLSITVSLSF